MSGPSASIIIPTKNRLGDLQRALASCRRQAAGVEILVMDDGSTDGTPEMVRRDFPEVYLHRDETSRSVTVQRNRGARLASGDIVFSIDDDAEFPSPHTVTQTLAEFDDPAIGAIAIPFINVNVSNRVLQRAPSQSGHFLAASFWGTAYAVRRDMFLQLGGYREALRQEMEEEDFCIRMLDAGYFTCLGRADPIHHYFSPVRDNPWRHRYGARNRVLFGWYNVPMPELVTHLAGTCTKRIAFGLRTRHAGLAMAGIADGMGAIAQDLRGRKPVRRRAYRLFRRLRKSPGAALSDEMRRAIRGAD